MARASIAMTASLVAGLGLGLLGRWTDIRFFYSLAGIGFVIAIMAAIAMTPWVKNMSWPPRMDGLFPRLEHGEELDPDTGHPQYRGKH